MVVQRRCDRGWQIPNDVHLQRLLKSEVYYISYRTSTHVCVVCVLQQNLLWIANFDKNSIGPNIKWIKLVDEFVSEYSVYVSNHHILKKFVF